MNNSTLKKLLTEYENKRINAIQMADIRKKELYLQYPDLKKIDDELNFLAISTAKSLINKNDPTLLEKFQEKINVLKNKKKQVLNSLGINESYFLPKFECNICKDTGYILEGSNSIMCYCLKQKIFDLEYNLSLIHI